MEWLHRLRESARPLARFGCVAIGTVYVAVGVLAVLALSGRLTGAADEDRMIHVLVDLPAGSVLIWTIILGMAGYVLWRAVEVISDPYDFGDDWPGIARRTAIGLSALGYGVLAFSAARIATGNGGGGNGDASEKEQQLLVAQVLDWPAGQWLIGAAGLLVVVVGLAQFGVLARGAYTTEIRLGGLSRRMRRVIHLLAWYGYSARAVILCVLGYFLLRGAVARDPEEVGDTDTAFDFIGGGTIGDTAFFVVALGTIAYGIFMYLNARFYEFQGDLDR